MKDYINDDVQMNPYTDCYNRFMICPRKVASEVKGFRVRIK